MNQIRTHLLIMHINVNIDTLSLSLYLDLPLPFQYTMCVEPGWGPVTKPRQELFILNHVNYIFWVAFGFVCSLFSVPYVA